MSINELKSVFKGETSAVDALKAVGGTLANIGTDMAVGTILAAGMGSKKGIKKAVCAFGILVLSMKVGEIAEDYFCEFVDDLKETFGATKKEIEEAVQEEKAVKAEGEVK